MQQRIIFFGPPGCGKTATLLERVEAADVPPEEIAFVAFTRKAAAEARGRAAERFGWDDDQLRWWRTLHSCAARQVPGVRDRLMGRRHWDELGDLLSMRFGDLDETGERVGRERGTRLRYMDQVARATRRDLLDVWEEHHDEEKWDELAWFSRHLARFKRQRDLLDYQDLLDEAKGPLPVRVAFLDEAQDLTPSQWDYALRALSGVERLYVAGDDDQALFDWAGGDVDRFLDLEGERTVLDRSHRLPRRVFDVAQRIVGRIGHRQPKTWSPDDREGAVHEVARPEDVPIWEGEWLLLGRTRMILDHWEQACRHAGVPYLLGGKSSVRPSEARAIRAWETWRRRGTMAGADLQEAVELAGLKVELVPDQGYASTDLIWTDLPVWHRALTGIPPARRRYYEECLRRDSRSLSREPRVTISTVHGAKGGEAPRVAVLTDITPRVEEGLHRNPDAEHRVWYVSVTRAREELFVVRPIGDRSYAL